MTMIISLISFLYLNSRSKIFLGDNGCYVISFILGYFLIRFYQNYQLNADTIFVLVFLPIVDMVRVIFFRLLKSGSAFRPDNVHIHHLLNNKFGKWNTILILSTASIIIIFLSLNFPKQNLYFIFSFIIFYFILIYNLKKKSKF